MAAFALWPGLHLSRAFGVIAVVVFAASLLGIVTRPTGLLASFWPANAILLGLVLRWPGLGTMAGWLGAIAGYCAADLMTGGSLLSTFLLTGANLVGVVTAYVFFRNLDRDELTLLRPQSILIMAAIAVVASGATAIVGIIPGTVLFNQKPESALLLWGVTELVNYITVLPVVLTFPAVSSWPSWPTWSTWRESLARFDVKRLAPVGGLVVCMVIGWLIGGPGAIGFAVTALLWSALTYSLFVTACLTLLVSFWTLVGYSLGYLGVAPGIDGTMDLVSFRIGVALVCLGPLAVASVMTTRDVLMAQLETAATYDFLTGALNRNGFERTTQAVLSRLRAGRQPVAMLVLDIDRFKGINDQFGHAAGDRVLEKFAETVRSVLRSTDLFGRTGGEEFAVVLPSSDRAGADRVAQEIRSRFAAQPVAIDDATVVPVTVSIGAAVSAPAPECLKRLTEAADKAVYLAKQGGRNRVVWHDNREHGEAG